MSTRIRLREDSITEAELHGAELRGTPPAVCRDCDDPACSYKPENYRKVPPAEPGDCWELRWHGTKALAGYAICCPRCRLVHHWDSANNCSSKRKLDGGGWTCDHSGTGSCWAWTGSAADGTLTASPSLFANGEGACGWHGWLRNGELVE